MSVVTGMNGVGADLMQTLIRQFGTYCVVAAYVAVTVAGLAVHLATCHESECETEAVLADGSLTDDGLSPGHCHHRCPSEPADSDQSPPEGNERKPHDSSTCQVCQELGTPQDTSVAVLAPELAELIEQVGAVANATDVASMVAAWNSRAPPA